MRDWDSGATRVQVTDRKPPGHEVQAPDFLSSCVRDDSVTTTLFCMPSQLCLAPPFRLGHNLEPPLTASFVQRPHKPSMTTKLFWATPARRAHQLHCFSYVAIRHVCGFHDEGLCFPSWRQGPSPASADPLGGAMRGLSMPHSPSTLTFSSLSLPPTSQTWCHQDTGKKKRQKGFLFIPYLHPAMFGWLVRTLLFHKVLDRALPFDPQNIAISHWKLLTRRHLSFWMWCLWNSTSVFSTALL